MSTTNPGSLSQITLFLLKLMTGAIFAISGALKLAGNADMVDLFVRIGLGQGFRYLTGGVELLCAILLFIPGATYYAATLLAAVMIAAIAFRVAIIGGGTTSPTILLVMLIVIAYLSRAGRRT